MPQKDEQKLPAHIMVRTKLSGKPRVTLLASNQELSYAAYEDVVIVSIPERLRASLAKQEAVVIKVAV
jgi:alpha-L-fucosidase